jgi:hypothetical protein
MLKGMSMSQIAIDYRGTAEEPLLHMLFPVEYAQFYLVDQAPRRELPLLNAPGESSAGILRTVPGGAFLVTGLALGVTDLTVGVSAHNPAARLDEFDDVVEASVDLDTPEVALVAWAGEARVVLPLLPAGPGPYRLRYHARGMDQARDRRSDTPIDSFFLQVWHEPISEPSVLKITSAKAQYWLKE